MSKAARRVDRLSAVRLAASEMRAAEERLDRARANLSETLREAKGRGAVLRELSEATGLSIQRVGQITGPSNGRGGER